MAEIKTKYAPATPDIVITLASLANNDKRESTALDNGTNLYLDAHVQLKVKTAASGSDATDHVKVFAYGTADVSTVGYSGDATGSDAVYAGNINNVTLIGIIHTPAANSSYASDVMSIAAAFGGSMPRKWGIIVENKTGAALDGTEANFEKKINGIKAQSI